MPFVTRIEHTAPLSPWEPRLENLHSHLATRICSYLGLEDLLRLRLVRKWSFPTGRILMIAREFGKKGQSLTEKEAVDYLGDQFAGMQCLPEEFTGKKESVIKQVSTLRKLKKMALPDFFQVYRQSHFTHTIREVRFLMQFPEYPTYPSIVRDNTELTPLSNAVQSGDAEAVALLLKKNQNLPYDHHTSVKISPSIIRCHLRVCVNSLPKRPDQIYVSPLRIAARRGDVKIMKLLIEHFGAHIVSISHPGHEKNALYYAIQSNSPKAVRFLLKHGASLFSKDRVCDTPLHYAAKTGNIVAIALLIKSAKQEWPDCDQAFDAFISAQNSNSETPLHYAIHEKQNNAARLLMQNGTYGNSSFLAKKSGNTGKTLLHTASQVGNAEALDLLIEKAKECMSSSDTAFEIFISAQDYHLETPLHDAILSRNTEAVKKLLQNGAPLLVWNNKRKTPLHYAAGGFDCGLLNFSLEADKNLLEILSILLEHAKEVYSNDAALFESFISYPDSDHRTALHYAVVGARHHLQSDSMEMLLKYGANSNFRDKEGNTPLHLLFCGNGLKKEWNSLVLILLQNGASPDAANLFTGKTPLHIAVQKKNIPLAETLLTLGADPNRGNTKGNTALHYACGNTHFDEKSLNLIHLLLEKNAFPNAINARKQTPLHLLAKISGEIAGNASGLKSQAIGMLLEKGGDLNLADLAGRTPNDYGRE